LRLADLFLGRNPCTTAIRIAALVLVAAVVFGWILIPVRLSGVSMLPTYDSGAFNFANRAAYWIREPARGDVVAIRMAGRRAVYVKRVIGLPGERIEIVQGTVLVNDEPLIERSVLRRAPWDYAAVVLGPDEYFVVGDNRSMRIEHHDLGRVKRHRIVGRLLF
jgi:signal peptidase I